MQRRLLIFITALILSSCSPVKTDRNHSEITKWETEIRKFEKLDQTENYPDNSIIFAGSSSIRLWKTLEADMYPYPVIQRGYGGASLSDFAVYAERILYPHKNSGIVLFFANDISGKENDKTPEEVLRLLKNVIKTIRKNFPESPIFWIGITPTERRWDVWPQIREANRLIQNYCHRNRNLFYIDTEKHFLNDNGLPKTELFVDDKLHLSREGYKVWSAIIKAELDKNL
jgi:lysophospholipase L1-like esterase